MPARFAALLIFQAGSQCDCKNCGAAIFGPSIGSEGGCNPVPMAYTVTGGNIHIPADALAKSSLIFKGTSKSPCSSASFKRAWCALKDARLSPSSRLLLALRSQTATLALFLTGGDRVSHELRSFGANITVTPESDTLPVEIGASIIVRWLKALISPKTRCRS